MAYLLTFALSWSATLINEVMPPLPLVLMRDSLGLELTRLLVRLWGEVVPTACLIFGVWIAWRLANRKRSDYRWLAVVLGAVSAGWKLLWLSLMFAGAMVNPTPFVRTVTDLDVYVSWALAWGLTVLALLILLEPRKPEYLPPKRLLACTGVGVATLLGYFAVQRLPAVAGVVTWPVLPPILASASLIRELGLPSDVAFTAASVVWIPMVWFLIARSIAGRVTAARRVQPAIPSA